MHVQGPLLTQYVHPGTVAVNQTAGNFPIKGRAFGHRSSLQTLEANSEHLYYKKLQDLLDSLQHFRTQESPVFPFKILVQSTVQQNAAVMFLSSRADFSGN